MKKIVVVAVVLAVLAAFGVGATIASAQGPTQNPTPGFGPGWMRGGFGWNADLHNQMQAALAKSLGLTVDQLNAELRAGKTIAQIAESKNVSLTQLHDAVQAAHKAIIQQAVKDGKLTQAQADWMIQRIDAMDKYWDANGGACPGWTGNWGAGYPGAMMGGFGRGGMMWGGRGPWTPPTTTR